MGHISDNIKETAKHFYKQPMGISTGFDSLDNALWGVHPRTLVMVGGRPSMGKSSIMADLVLATSKEVPVGVFSKEMGNLQFPPRLACNLAGVNYHKVHTGSVNKKEQDDYFAAFDEVSKLPIYVDYNRYIVGSENYWVKARTETEPNIKNYIMDFEIKKWVQEHGVKVIFADYLQIFDLLNKSIKDQRLKVGKIAEILRDYAKEYNITMVLLSQLRRPDPREGKMPVPTMKDLLESGQLEAHSDVILLLHRPAYYDEEKKLDLITNIKEDDAQLILSKNRDGMVGNIDVDFWAYSMSYKEKGARSNELPF